jgi:hypothetical protein
MGFNNNSLKAEWWIGPNSISCTSIQNDKETIASIVGYK